MENIDIQQIKNRFGIIGNSDLLNHAIRVAAQVAPTDMSVLINGESGVGKESFSKIIHQLSTRKHGPFIAINCGAIPEGTIDSELFGHEKGSFTGAHDARKGYFETTDGGTIFLDEIGEMPLGTQARLLRVLENGEFIKVGSSKVLKTNVRVVAATNVDLQSAVDKNKFREDLYYRLSTVPVFVPPLRERGQDIELLFLKFATDFAEKYRMEPLTLSDDATNMLLKFRFPGNIRQLKNIVEQISILELERRITSQTLKKYLPMENNQLPTLFKSESDKNSDFTERDILYRVLFEMKNDMIELKKLVHSVLKNERSSKEILEENESLFENINEKKYQVSLSEPYVLKNKEDENELIDDNEYEFTDLNIEDTEHEIEEESLSLEKKEKEMILKALRKNNNKRKYAAGDLGISERTLYRKIKQYDIED